MKSYILMILLWLINTTNALYSNNLFEVSSGGASFSSELQTSDPVNALNINSLRFDTSTARIHISYCFDSTVSDISNLEIAITGNLNEYSTQPSGFPTVRVLSPCTDTIVTLPEPIRFDTLYYIALWLREPGGVWNAATEKSRDTVRIGKPYKQVFDLFDPSKTIDTVSLFNNTILLWKDRSFSEEVSYEYTIKTDEIFTSPKGMIPVAAPFYFVDPEPTFSFYIAFKVTSLPIGSSFKNVRIYKTSQQKTSVAYATEIDSLHNLVYFKTNDLSSTFSAMIDTARPVITFIDSNRFSPVVSTESIHDNLTLKDNICNLQYRFYCSKGNELPSLKMTDSLTDYEASVTLTVSDSMHVISSEYGLRSWVIVTDGVHIDTIDLSRAVYRGESDPMTTVGGTWNPVFPTAELLNKKSDFIISQLKNDTILGYDNRYMRMFRWIQYNGNVDSSNKWVEYDTSNLEVQQLFSLEPGTMIWIKTLENRPVHLGSAYTLSPADTFDLVLPPQQWTDFGMPFRFPVPLSLVFALTNSNAQYIDVCSWNLDAATGQFYLAPYFIHGMANQPVSPVLEYSPKGGYCFFNHHYEAITLRIPGILPAMITAKKKGVAHKENTWGVTFSAQANGSTHKEKVYCGYTPEISYRTCPAGPSFSSLRVYLVEHETRQLVTSSIGSENNDGFTREVTIRNNSEKAQTVNWQLFPEGEFPSLYHSRLYDPKTGTVSTTEGKITVQGKSALSRIIISGNAAYHNNSYLNLENVQFKLHAPYPNPAFSKVCIRYTVPIASQERIRVSIHSLSGRMIWSASSDRYQKAGTHSIVWDGNNHNGKRASSGVYIIRLETISQSTGSALKHFEKRVTYLQ